jgi:hypothetical protein
LNDKDVGVRYFAAAGLGSIGGESKAVIPLLIEGLKDKGKYNQEYALEKATDAFKVISQNFENKAVTMPIADLDQAISDLEKALQSFKNTQDKNLESSKDLEKAMPVLNATHNKKLESNIASINHSLDHLKKTRESRLLDRTLEWLAKHPLAIGGLICIIFFPFLWVKLSQVQQKPTA